MNPEKLAKMAASVRTGGKGSVRRKKKAIHKTTTTDDKRLQNTLKRLGVNNIPAIEEVNLFKDNGTVIHFTNPKVQASIQANTYVISGHAETKKLQDLLPGIINQLGPDNLAALNKMATDVGSKSAGGAIPEGDEDDDDMPDLVDNFETAKKRSPRRRAPQRLNCLRHVSTRREDLRRGARASGWRGDVVHALSSSAKCASCIVQGWLTSRLQMNAVAREGWAFRREDDYRDGDGDLIWRSPGVTSCVSARCGQMRAGPRFVTSPWQVCNRHHSRAWDLRFVCAPRGSPRDSVKPWHSPRGGAAGTLRSGPARAERGPPGGRPAAQRHSRRDAQLIPTLCGPNPTAPGTITTLAHSLRTSLMTRASLSELAVTMHVCAGAR
eukprot:CAMPEP_0206041884 /NCGR_PEP_ID=MMETSP1466-20131121/6223_1 /ASSEMBLY_ACC=CAM_ASM_001126 /TAXON_ID=44452 /ORGANISM="Pavlova gyrans, Strain CCMP608" /LENGTH=380 /DNA_ID=CAMNT_0053416587 /DNA_START=40 /DNA_END=1181 /DNA_ORIENTATION=+